MAKQSCQVSWQGTNEDSSVCSDPAGAGPIRPLRQPHLDHFPPVYILFPD